MEVVDRVGLPATIVAQGESNVQRMTELLPRGKFVLLSGYGSIPSTKYTFADSELLGDGGLLVCAKVSTVATHRCSCSSTYRMWRWKISSSLLASACPRPAKCKTNST